LDLKELAVVVGRASGVHGERAVAAGGRVVDADASGILAVDFCSGSVVHAQVVGVRGGRHGLHDACPGACAVESPGKGGAGIEIVSAEVVEVACVIEGGDGCGRGAAAADVYAARAGVR